VRPTGVPPFGDTKLMIQSDPLSTAHESRRPRSGPFASVLNLFSSVWLGVFWAVLLFIYCSIGSAVPQVRQLPQLEMTEFEWSHWWPFNVLIVLLCTTLTVVTVRRIPLRLVNAECVDDPHRDHRSLHRQLLLFRH
jgi:hypothetical protein